MSLKILVNASTCVVGGGVQVATSFIRQALSDTSGPEFSFAVSAIVDRNLGDDASADPRVRVLTPSPARVWKGQSSRRTLRSMEQRFRPDAVFTVFGPAYHRFSAPHICGFADPWVTHASSLAMNHLRFPERVKRAALSSYKTFRMRREDFYWVETTVAQQGLARRLRIPESRVRVISNTYAEVFRPAEPGVRSSARALQILTLAAPYRHKNLTLIPEVAARLREEYPDKTYRFVVTLPDSGGDVGEFWRLVEARNVGDRIENVGPLTLDQCPAMYHRSDIIFLPTLLETFSATYPEAMVMGKPIVTTDLDFARDICGNAALYFEPLSAEAAADALRRVSEDAGLRERLTANGSLQLKHFPSPDEKYRLTMEWIRTVTEQSRL